MEDKKLYIKHLRGLLDAVESSYEAAKQYDRLLAFFKLCLLANKGELDFAVKKGNDIIVDAEFFNKLEIAFSDKVSLYIKQGTSLVPLDDSFFADIE